MREKETEYAGSRDRYKQTELGRERERWILKYCAFEREIDQQTQIHR